MSALEIAAQSAAWLASDAAREALEALQRGDLAEAGRKAERAMMDAARAVSLIRECS